MLLQINYFKMTRVITSLCLLIFLLTSCQKDTNSDLSGINFREEMRTFVKEISSFTRSQKNNFIIIPQNGQELLTANGEASGTPVTSYINAISGVGREELFYGYDNHDDQPTPGADSENWRQLCLAAKNNGLKVLTTDYCTTPSKIADSYQRNNTNGFISFAATHRELDNIPAGTPYLENTADIITLNAAKNFLYIINTAAFTTKLQMLNAMKQTNYDVIIMDAFFQEGGNNTGWTAAEINQLKTKLNGGKRLVIAYMSIGEAEDYRYYWKTEWNNKRPAWLENLNPQWPGNYEVKYWNPEWKQIITGNSSSYSQKILDAAFDGLYLDIIDGFEYWESK